jgi:hypothetical protein
MLNTQIEEIKMAKALAKVAKLPLKGRSRAQWADAINKSWKIALEAATSAVNAGITTGEFLLKAKEEVPYGEFQNMIKEDLAFNATKAHDLMRIASSPVLAKERHGGLLPSGWTVLRKLAELKAEDFQWAKDHGLINKDMTRGSAIAIKHARRTNAKIIHINKGERGPTPKEAREIARATGRLVVASDGRMYTGTTEEEDEKYASRRVVVYGIKEAIRLIATCKITPCQWCETAEDHWIFDFKPNEIDGVVGWLTDLKPALAKRLKAVKNAQ